MFEFCGKKVPLYMVDTKKRQATGHRKSTSEPHAYEQAPLKTRPRRHSDMRNCFKANSSILKDLIKNEREISKMLPRSKLWNYPSILSMKTNLRRNPFRKEFSFAIRMNFQQRSGSLITTTFKPHYKHCKPPLRLSDLWLL
jgi:hypothetical protein